MRATLKSIEKRCEKSDQDIFIAPVILNPLYKASPFSSSVKFMTATGVWELCSRLWMRFYKEEAPIQLYRELVSYLSNQDRYGKLPDHIRRETALAASENKSVNPMSIYIAMTNLVNPLPTPLERLARHQLTVSANSASCERLFSAFGLILTRLRSRMSIKSMTDLAEL
ncbi:hypothetical protein SERLADRAFT_433098 [Serpula lacrymans var. lacrymans S7.9]|uniref:HAT C-terminal dimerisation domain-containing protein n=2 Tax=Serpula lacrymans var. lacrymans TaxID=341189 RepID=F8NGK9_SERL9|nr:uncharacterized protein SERLADRAFT_433098 [Serpula lacrymans var. lacrymans S7.9]EGO29091.1 hypothetical protein SERLADRAFT_433098 [Serpula lacrymans var. lacrymans S7.9]